MVGVWFEQCLTIPARLLDSLAVRKHIAEYSLFSWVGVWHERNKRVAPFTHTLFINWTSFTISVTHWSFSPWVGWSGGCTRWTLTGCTWRKMKCKLEWWDWWNVCKCSSNTTEWILGFEFCGNSLSFSPLGYIQTKFHFIQGEMLERFLVKTTRSSVSRIAAHMCVQACRHREDYLRAQWVSEGSNWGQNEEPRRFGWLLMCRQVAVGSFNTLVYIQRIFTRKRPVLMFFFFWEMPSLKSAITACQRLWNPQKTSWLLASGLIY